MNKILFWLFGSKSSWLQKRLVKSVINFNNIHPYDYTCPFVITSWGHAGADWYKDKMAKYAEIDTEIPFTILAVENRTSAKIERAKFLQQLAKDYE